MKSFLSKILLISILLQSDLVFSASSSDPMMTWKQKGFLFLSVPVKLDKLEPTSFLNAHTKLSLPLIYEPLVSVVSKQDLQPILAKSWLIADDNKSIIVTIKPHHFFSNNTEVTANDVANSIERVCSKNSKVFEDIKGLRGCSEHTKGKNVNPGISVIDKYRIKFTINCSPTNFLYQLASPSLVITKLTNAELIGSGPYVVQENKNNHLILKPNPHASKENQALNPGVVIFYANWDKLPAILEEDKPDGSIMYRMQDVWNIHNKNYNLMKINPNITEILVLNNQRFPFSNVQFRKAFSAELYNNFNQKCIPGAHKAYGLIPYGTGGSIDGNPPQLLPEIPTQELFQKIPELKTNNVKVVIHQLCDSKNECESKQIIDTAKKFNIDLKFNYHKNYTALEPLYLNHELDGFIELYVFRNREAYSILQFFTKAGANHANVSGSKIDTMLQHAIKEASSHRRFQSYQRIAKYIQNEGIVVPLFYMDHANILSKCLTGASDNFLFNPFLHISQLHKIENCHI